MPEPTAYYEVTVRIAEKTGTATFYQSENGQFDLLYGWAAYTASMSSTLQDAMEDFRGHLQGNNPGKDISLGEPRQISKEQAERNSPNYTPPNS